MRFYSIIKSTHNSIINTWTNKNILLNDIVNYTTLDIHYTIVFKSQNGYVHLNLDSILQNVNCLNMTIGEFAEFICKDKYIETYECNDSFHPNLHKYLCGFSLGDVIDQTDIKFYDPSNVQYTSNFAIESATDLAINIQNKQNDKLIPIFGEDIMFNDGNVSYIIIKDMKDVIANKYNQAIPLEKFHFLDLQPFGNSVTIVKLSKLNYEIDDHMLLISDIYKKLSNAKGCLVILDRKFIPWKLIKLDGNTIKINLNHLLALEAFQKYTADELLSSYHSFIILFKNKIFCQILNGISDIAHNSGNIYSIGDPFLNSIYFLNIKNYGLTCPTSLKVMLEDQNAQILFDETYENAFESANSFREHYNEQFVRTHTITNYTFSQDQNLVPLYEDPDIYKYNYGQFGHIDNPSKHFIPIRFVFSN